MNIQKQVGERVRDLRQEKGMLQSELAKEVNLQRTHISRIENGNFKIQIDTLVLLAQGLRVTLSEFFETIQIEDIYESRNRNRGRPL